MTRILVLGGRATMLRKAVDLGYEVVYVQKPAYFDPATISYCSQVHLLDFQDIPLITSVAQAIHAVTPFDRVITQIENGQMVAAHLTDVLRLPGVSRAMVSRLHDKSALRNLLNEARLSPVDAVVATTRGELHDFLTRHGSAVVKPLMGSGSLGVRKIGSPADLDTAWQWLQDLKIDKFLVEELLHGPEFSVETFSNGAEHDVIAITGKFTGTGVVELAHVVPAQVSAVDAEEIGALVRALLDAVGYRDGPAHTEVILTPAGPRIIESHARRGGDHIPDLVELVYGVDLEKLTFALVEGVAHATVKRDVDRAAAIHFLVADPGVVTEVSGVEEASAVPGVVRVDISVEEGDVVHELRWSEDRCGYVIVQDRDPDIALATAREAVRMIEIRTSTPAERKVQTLGEILAAAHEIHDPFDTVSE